ncbi:PQQ-binding-like beta-propeller repeat protein [Actinocorallia sp. B10E7]|uniref:outer membrane protein assembly factor BamB family protein n=1 Tax=Actinocorallia sp. B10E7 TaxID=3153558 RepID=UPI00325C5A2B
MSRQTDYLELSKRGTTPRFYEVERSGARVTVTYGQVGKAGRTRTTEFDTERKAIADTASKLNDRFYAGYVRAVRGMGPKPTPAPVLWRMSGIARTYGLFVDDRHCWVGDQRGEVSKVRHDGTVSDRFRLPGGVRCIVADGFWVYAGCNDGRVYDLGGKVPRVAYEIAENTEIYWLDVNDGMLGVSDKTGQVTLIDHEDESQWSRKSGGSAAWMVRCDEEGLYCGHSRGVSRFRIEDGTPVWSTALPGGVLFGWQEGAMVYAGTENGKVYQLAKDTGRVETIYSCDASVFSCSTTPGGGRIFAADNMSSVYCFDRSGVRLWKVATGCGSAYSMQYFDGRLYLATTMGAMVCVDVSEEALQAAGAGSVPQVVDVKTADAPAVVEPTTVLESAASAEEGVVLECFEEGSRLRVRAVSSGYDSTWNVQFPKDIREPGTRYLVEGVRPALRGGFYRAYGDIRRLS